MASCLHSLAVTDLATFPRFGVELVYLRLVPVSLYIEIVLELEPLCHLKQGL